MRRAAFTSVWLLLLVAPALAQTESTLYSMNSLPQVVEANPAIMPRYRLSIGLPVLSSVSGVYSNNGFTYNDFVTKVDGVAKVDLTTWTKSLADKNYVSLAGSVDLLRVGVRLNQKLYLMVSSTVQGYNRSMIPKGLASLLVDGTAPIVGSFSNTSPQQETLAFIASNVGVSYNVNEKLTVGGRIKYLVGLGNISTESSSVVVQVDQNYAITATADARVRTSGVYNLSNDGDFNLSDNMKSSGWGLDIGATYKFMDKLTLGASLNNIGFIKWNYDTYEYSLDPATAKYTFSGIDVTQLLDNNSGYLQQQLDSLKKRFEMREAPTGSYTTSLPGKFFLSANYELIPNLSIGALYFGEKFKDRFSSGLTASVNKNFGKLVSTSLTYTVSNRSYNNIGFGVSFNITPVQLYFVGDNLLRAPASLVTDQSINSFINSSQLLTLRAGLNIVIGWDQIGGSKKKVEDDSHNPKEKGAKTKVKATHGGSNPKKTSNKKVKHTFGRSPAKKKK